MIEDIIYITVKDNISMRSKRLKINKQINDINNIQIYSYTDVHNTVGLRAEMYTTPMLVSCTSCNKHNPLLLVVKATASFAPAPHRALGHYPRDPVLDLKPVNI